MKQNNSSNKLFLEILPDNISFSDISEFFSKNRIKLLKQSGIKTAFILSSEPVDSQIYLSLINIFNKSGIQVLSFYFDTPDAKHVDSLRAAVNDLNISLSRGGCLIISYRSRFSLPLIASLHIFNGKSVDEAISTVQQNKKDSTELNMYRNILVRFQDYLTHPADDVKHIRDAIQINKPGMIKKPVSRINLL